MNVINKEDMASIILILVKIERIGLIVIRPFGEDLMKK
jgi:hypothetical protein